MWDISRVGCLWEIKRPRHVHNKILKFITLCFTNKKKEQPSLMTVIAVQSVISWNLFTRYNINGLESVRRIEEKFVNRGTSQKKIVIGLFDAPIWLKRLDKNVTEINNEHQIYYNFHSRAFAFLFQEWLGMNVLCVDYSDSFVTWVRIYKSDKMTEIKNWTRKSDFRSLCDYGSRNSSQLPIWSERKEWFYFN